MKKTLFTSLALISFFISNAQIWFDAGIKGGYTPGIVVNNNLFSNTDYKLKFAGGYTFGGKLGINFNDQHSLTVDFMYSKLGLKTEVLGKENLLSQTAYQIPILYRKNSENGGYGEIGPQITLHTGADLNGTDVSNQFGKTSYGIVVGGGQYIGGGDVMGITLGVRFAYNFTDMVSPDFNKATGNAVYTPTSLDKIAEFSYAASNQFYAGLVLEVNMNIGYFTHGSGCKKGTRFKLF